jgi:CubicO group peptidase (beta-lactamase class C family)
MAATLADCGGGGGGAGDSGTPLPSAQQLNARAKTFELDTPYVAPPGDPLEHHTSGYAKAMCSAVFITGMDIDAAAENVGYFTGPYAYRAVVGRPEVDRVKQQVSIAMPNGGPTLVARYHGSQGCITLPRGHDDVFFTPVAVTSSLPDPATQAWPMGDVLPNSPPPASVDMALVQHAVNAAFSQPLAYTSAFLVTHKGRLIAERYMNGAGPTARLESWSMGKSVVASLMGVLIQQGAYQLDQAAPIPQWQAAGDPRQQIRIADLMRMSSGLRIKAPDDPDFDYLTYPDHTYFYTGRINIFDYAATRPQQWPPNTIGRYRNTDPVLISYLIRLAVEKRSEQYLSFPQRELFDKIGIRTMVMETDPYGNFESQGYDFMSARDWARLANLYLQDGVWNGERILPEGFVRFVSTVAPAWAADGRSIYGAFFWINGAGIYPLPTTAYFMLGAGGQFVFIDPSHDLVVVRMGYSKGGPNVHDSLSLALQLLMLAIPRS